MKINFDSIKKYYEKRDNEVKEAIKRAKKAGMHPTFIKLLETQGKINVKHKLPLVLRDGATEEQIVKFEEAMGVTIPAPYRELLKFTNGAKLGEASVEFFGLEKNKNSLYTLYTINDADKIENISGVIENKWLIIGEDIASNLICISLETGEIYSWDYRNIGDEECFLNTDFYTYMEEDLIGFMYEIEREGMKND